VQVPLWQLAPPQQRLPGVPQLSPGSRLQVGQQAVALLHPLLLMLPLGIVVRQKMAL
jgi:hypothetical protein